MANTDRINGLRAVKFDDSLIYPCYKAAGTTVTNDMFVGDPVVLAGSADSATGNPSVTVATAGAGNAIYGVVNQIALQPATLDRASWIDGADDGTVMVLVDPRAVYEGQADEALAVTDVGMNANVVLTQSGSRTSGASGFEVDATVATTNTCQLKIIGFPNRADNEIGAVNNKVLVTINNRQLVGDTGSTGV